MTRILFLLPGEAGGGGAHSVVQETLGMKRLGAEAAIATGAEGVSTFHTTYPELEAAGVKLHGFADAKDITAMMDTETIVCATSWDSVDLLRQALIHYQGPLPRTAYYIQDYEPLFCPPGSSAWQRARHSYTAIPGMILFAKTRFLCDLVAANHGLAVHKVSPSLDHAIYRPTTRTRGGALAVTAMLRPRTPRRAPNRTASILEQIAACHGDQVRCISFGCSDEALSLHGIRLSGSVDHRGVLDRHAVAALLAESDLFLDLSDYQAFGRTGLEAMACGAVPALPAFGGADEYLKHWQNGFRVDTRSDPQILDTASTFIRLPMEMRNRMRHAAMATAADYSIEKAARSELALFQ